MSRRPPLPLYCGVDVGACATKLVLLDDTSAVQARVVRPSGVDYVATSRECLQVALKGCGSSEGDIVRTVATGYGRQNVDFADTASTEIHCHGIGAYYHQALAQTVVDIGGQDNKVIRLAADGRRIDFKMNRKCAAGTGTFIEEIALRLGIELSDMDRLARSTGEAVKLSSFCTVFAATEILAHLRRGERLERIVRGVFASVVSRVMEMAPLDGVVLMSGGVVAHNPTIADLLSERLGSEVGIAPHPQLTGALGAALTALKQATTDAGAEPERTPQQSRTEPETQARLAKEDENA